MTAPQLNDLKHFWMPSGVPCFIADRQDICDVVENMGFQIYYLLSNHKTETKSVTNSTPSASPHNYGYTTYGNSTITSIKIEKKPRLFKVVNNYVGRVVAVSNDEFPAEFIDIEDECTYSMPLIPIDVVNKLDEFFRLVHSQHGTESIVILTYDTTKTGPAGWGVLVPEQTNTAAHCKYDADSIVALKPENVMIVGSVHSHPDMPAYASGTDHDDQADFDGLHITYGWQKSVNNGATQYYAELQMAGTGYKLDMEDVFETVTVQKDPDPEVVEWSTKVKKAYPPYQGGHSTIQNGRDTQTTQTTTPQQQPGLQTGKAVGGSRTPLKQARFLEKYEDVLAAYHMPYNAVLAIEAELDERNRGHCLVCETEINISDVRIGLCPTCEVPLVHSEDHMSTIVEKVESYLIDNYLPYTTPVYLYSFTDDNLPSIMNISDELRYYTGTAMKPIVQNSAVKKADVSDLSDYVHLPTHTEDVIPIDSAFSSGHTACCGVRIENAEVDCVCAVRLMPDDVVDFDSYLAENADIYVPNSPCHDCTHFYSIKCPAFRELLTEWVRSRDSFNIILYTHSVNGCSNYEHYANSFAEIQYNDEIR